MLRNKIVELDYFSKVLERENKVLRDQIAKLEAEKSLHFDRQRRQREFMLAEEEQQQILSPRSTPKSNKTVFKCAERSKEAPPQRRLSCGKQGNNIVEDYEEKTITFSNPGTSKVGSVLLNESWVLKDSETRPLYSEIKVEQILGG